MKKKVPHLFGKVIVFWCIICMTVFSTISFYVTLRTGVDTSPTLLATASFFGGELLFLAARRIFKERKPK